MRVEVVMQQALEVATATGALVGRDAGTNPATWAADGPQLATKPQTKPAPKERRERRRWR